ncbi:hypothetical protein EOD41_01510 [Mucilaginibacter limnophilus]|uniref:Uncharacterized protein n=1 Tax=Mucilaginibacter limnophilus TaxID=1932778 RepID=A0A3S2VAA7_9SPHI|nr:hypothetical protein [Mucilaginibacter limnophilus]RVU02645.1 hypothetical protein EOD41_01510 [Mucilaginibacter limnophilus]
MRIPSLISLLGFILIVVATYCPMLCPLGLMNWNVFDLNKPYAIAMLLVAVIGIIGVVFSVTKVARIAAWLSLVLAVLLYAAAYFQVKDYFTFIPFKGIATFLTSKIKFKWGWYVLFTGAVLALSSIFIPKKQEVYNKTT